MELFGVWGVIVKTKNSFSGFLNFEVLITPKIIVVLYWILTVSLLITLIGGAIIANDKLFGLSLAIIIILRLAFEMMIIAFKNNEFARRSCVALETLVSCVMEQQKTPDKAKPDAEFQPPPKNG